MHIVSDKMPDSEYRSLLQSLNLKQQEFLPTLFMQQNIKLKSFCALHRDAGTGKSFVLKALYKGLYHLLCHRAGQYRDDYRILVVVPTGKAAYNVKGSNLHSAQYIPANQSLNEYKQMSHGTLNTYRVKYNDYSLMSFQWQATLF